MYFVYMYINEKKKVKKRSLEERIVVITMILQGCFLSLGLQKISFPRLLFGFVPLLDIEKRGEDMQN